jgi:hypothetical protein
MEKIGFTTEFYTLWDVNNEDIYTIDHNGKAWLTGTVTHFHYIKNISIDLDKVKSQYPNHEIDMDLRGQGSYDYQNKEEDLCPEILKFGKYRGYSISELVQIDFNYLLWLSGNAYGKVRGLVQELPEMKEYLAAEEAKRQEKMDSLPVIESGEVELTFTSNPNHQVGGYIDVEGLLEEGVDLTSLRANYYSGATIGEGSGIKVIFNDIVKIQGLYPYNMASINGKAQKVKDKTIKVNVEVLYTRKYNNFVEQIVIIK